MSEKRGQENRTALRSPEAVILIELPAAGAKRRRGVSAAAPGVD